MTITREEKLLDDIGALIRHKNEHIEHLEMLLAMIVTNLRNNPLAPEKLIPALLQWYEVNENLEEYRT